MPIHYQHHRQRRGCRRLVCSRRRARSKQDGAGIQLYFRRTAAAAAAAAPSALGARHRKLKERSSSSKQRAGHTKLNDMCKDDSFSAATAAMVLHVGYGRLWEALREHGRLHPAQKTRRDYSKKAKRLPSQDAWS